MTFIKFYCTISGGYCIIELSNPFNAVNKEKITNKLELIEAFRKDTDLTKAEASSVVHILFDSMADALEKGDRVEVHGLLC